MSYDYEFNNPGASNDEIARLLLIDVIIHFRFAKIVCYIESDLLFFILLTCASIIAIGLCTIEDSDSFTIGTAITVYLILSASLPTFVFCHLSEKFTNDLSDISDLFFNSAWHKLPVKKQRYIALAIQASQRPIRLKGYQIVSCSLQVFSSVREFNNI